MLLYAENKHSESPMHSDVSISGIVYSKCMESTLTEVPPHYRYVYAL